MRDPHLWEAVVLVLGLAWTMRVAAGRLSPRVVVAPILFLVTRTAVLIGWGVGTIAMFALIVTSAHANGKDPTADLPMLIGVSAFSGLGFAALVIGPVFMLIRARTPAPELALEPGERLVEEIVANHFLGGESRGGKLLLTDRRVAFRSHRFNVQLDTWSTPLADIRAVRTEGARFLLVTTTDGTEHWIVVWRNRDVAAKLEVKAGR